MTPPKIPGFATHGTRYRAPVSLSEADAQDVAKEAADRGVPVSIVLMERVRHRGRVVAEVHPVGTGFVPDRVRLPPNFVVRHDGRRLIAWAAGGCGRFAEGETVEEFVASLVEAYQTERCRAERLSKRSEQ